MAAGTREMRNDVRRALQPGPAALTEGAAQLAAIVGACARGEHLPRPRAEDLRRADLEGERFGAGDGGAA